MQPNSETKIVLRPVGVIRSCFQQKFGTPRQGAHTPSSRATIELDKRWIGAGSLDGLKGFSHVWIVSWLHHSSHDREQVKTKVHPPRLEGEKRGVFATRSPHHPNPVGLTLARLEEVGECHLIVSGLDLIEGTPVLDLKPYLPDADRPEEFSRGWLDRVQAPVWAVQFSGESLEDIRDLCERGVLPVAASDFQRLLVEMIQDDPRPLSYRDKNREPYAVHVYQVNVLFEFRGDHFAVTRCEEKHQGQKNTPIMANPTGPIQRA